jgi:hypothetical protein
MFFFGFSLSSRVDAAIQLFSTVINIFPKQNYENYRSDLMEEIYISELELQRWSLKIFISFSKIYFWYLGLRFGQVILGPRNPSLV